MPSAKHSAAPIPCKPLKHVSMDIDCTDVDVAYRKPSHTIQPSSPSDRTGSPDSLSSTSTVSSSRMDSFFRTVHGRQLNTMNPTYVLPSDALELKRLDQEHRMIKFILGGRNYVGDIAEVLAVSRHKEKRILDCGTGGGQWAIEVAEECPQATVVGVDLAPIQPRDVPPNCQFEIFDLDGQQLPFPNDYFDVIHCRSIYTGLRNYPLFLRECARILRKSGLIILAEADSAPLTESKRPMSGDQAPGWVALWDEYRRGLTELGIDITIPTRLRALLQEIPSLKDNIVAQEALVPVGFWPKDQVLLTIGQLAWMNHDNLIPALIPQLRTVNGLTEAEAAKLVEDAQHDLYFPNQRPFSCWHIAHARKSNTVR